MATGDNREVYSTLERILNTATAVGGALMDEETARDTEFISHVSELLRLAERPLTQVYYELIDSGPSSV